MFRLQGRDQPPFEKSEVKCFPEKMLNVLLLYLVWPERMEDIRVLEGDAETLAVIWR